MTLRRRLYAVVSIVAIGTAALAVAGYLLTLKFSTAIYEIGAVRLPSVASLAAMEEAARGIAHNSRPAVFTPPEAASIHAAIERKSEAWKRFRESRSAYEPLPQTGREAVTWAEFSRAAEEWADDDAEVTRVLLLATGDPYAVQAHALADLARRARRDARRAIRQIHGLIRINEEAARDATQSTIATFEDARRIQAFMFVLGGLALGVNLWLAFLFHRTIARPLSDAEVVIRRITEGDLSARAKPGADDTTGHLVDSLNRLAEKLEDSEASRQAIGANLPHSMIYQVIYEPVTGPRFLQISANVEQIAGISRADLFANPGLLDERVLPEDRKVMLEARARVMATGIPLELTVRARNADGRLVDLHVTSAIRRLANGSIISDGVITDVTETMEAQRRLSALARTLRTIGRCRHAVVHATNEQSLLQEVCDAVEEDDSYRTVWVAYRVDDPEKSVRSMAQAGVLPDFPLGSMTRWDESPQGDGPVGRALRHGTIQVSEDILSDPRSGPWKESAQTWGIASVLAFPLKENGETFAALAIYSVDRGPRSADEIALLTELVADLEYGILALRARRRLDESVQELRVSEERFRSAMSQSPVGMSISDFDGRWLEVNQALCDITGYSREELLSSTFQAITHPDDIETDVAMARRVRSGELPWFRMQKRYIRKNGSIAWVELHVTLIRDASGEPLHFVAQIVDINARREADEAALVNRTQLRIAAEVAGLYYWEYRILAGKFVYDRGMHALFRLPEAQPEPLGVEDFLSRFVAEEDVARVREEFTRALRESRDHELCNIEYRTRAVNGSRGTVSVSFLVERDEEGRAVLVRGSIQDITERERMREQLAQVQKMEAIGQLAGGVAHDFNNFLTVILGYGQILTSSLDAGDRRHAMAAQIVDAAERSAALTAQLLSFSRREVLAPKTLDLNEVVHGIEKMLRRLIGEDVALALSLAGLPAVIRADPSQLQQVLVNLAVNARDAMPRGGRLRISTEVTDVREARVSTFGSIPPGRYVRLEVADNGTGIPEDVQRQMFEPFYTTKGQGKGTGLGLAVVYGAVRQSAAFIEVHSALGAGTRFSIYFPRAKADVADEAGPAEPAPGGEETILLVEDEDSIRALCLDALEGAGYRVFVAADGEEGLEAAAKLDSRLDLLVTDVVMPRLGGAELSRRLRMGRPDLKVLFVSGYTDDEVLKQGIRRREVAFLQKPYRMADLLRTVREVLDSAPAEGVSAP